MAASSDPRSILTPDVDPTAEASAAAPGAPVPSLRRTEEAMTGPTGQSVGITVLVVLAVLYTLYFARDFLLPITLAVLLDFLFSPLVRALSRLHVPTPVGAGVVVLGLVGALGLGAYELTEPVQGWIAKAPETMQVAQSRLRRVTRPVEQVSKTAEQVANAASISGQPAKEPQVVVQQGPSLISRIFGTTQRLVAGLLEVLVLLYFLLAAGDLFLQKLIKVLPNLHDKRTAVQIARETEASVSTYLLTQFAINLGEGVAVAGALYLLDVPNPALWGALVVVLEFVPYLGATVMVGLLGLVGLTAFDSVGRAMLAPAAFLAINLLQANFITPMLLGKKLTLNPVAIFVGLAFWWWLWGVPGAFISVPLLATFKIFCDHIDALAPIGEFLGERDERERRRSVRADAQAAG